MSNMSPSISSAEHSWLSRQPSVMARTSLSWMSREETAHEVFIASFIDMFEDDLRSSGYKSTCYYQSDEAACSRKKVTMKWFSIWLTPISPGCRHSGKSLLHLMKGRHNDRWLVSGIDHPPRPDCPLSAHEIL